MRSLEEVLDDENSDPELIPDYLPVDARMSAQGPVSVFLEVFGRAVPLIPIVETLDGTGFMLLEFGPDVTVAGWVQATSTNGEHTIRSRADGVKIQRAGRALVPGKKIHEILTLLRSDDTVKIDVVGMEVHVYRRTAKWTVQATMGDSLPPLADFSSVEFFTVHRDLFESALRAVQPALPPTGGKVARPTLVQVQLKDGLLTACDGARVHRQRLEGAVAREFECAIPLRSVAVLLKEMASSQAEYFRMGADDYHIIFLFERTAYITQRLLMPFPDIDSVMINPAFQNKYQLTVRKDELAEAVKNVRVSADPDSPVVHLGILPDRKDENGVQLWKLAAYALDKRHNVAQDVMSAEFEGTSAREVIVRHKHLSELLAVYPGETITFRVGDDTKSKKLPLYVQDEENGFTAVLQQLVP